MGKKLSEMSREELWRLFPIFLQEHQPCWESWYRQEAALLQGALLPAARIHHVGSTAIPAIWAKPIIDILVEVPRERDLLPCRDALEKLGYTCKSRSENQIFFNKGYTESGFAERVFHLHLRLQGDNAELYFRDYLRDHPQAAKEYEKLKLGLWKTYEHDRDGYTNAKTAFIRECTEKARQLYGGRYAPR